MRRRAWLCFAAAAAAAFLVPARPDAGLPRGPLQGAPQPARGAASGALVRGGAEADLALIYTGGVVGYVEPCG